MKHNPAIYVASRASVPERPAMWRALRDIDGWNIVSTWIDEAGPGETKDHGDLWARVEQEIARCDALILFVAPEDFPLKGALVEVGMALGMGKPVAVANDCDRVMLDASFAPLGSWVAHGRVSLHRTVYDAHAWVKKTINAHVEAQRFKCDNAKAKHARMETEGAFTSEEFGFAIEMALQYGANHVDDDATVLQISDRDLYVMMKVLGYGRKSATAQEAPAKPTCAWSNFLAAQVRLIHEWRAEGKTFEQIAADSRLHDGAHAERIYQATIGSPEHTNAVVKRQPSATSKYDTMLDAIGIAPGHPQDRLASYRARVRDDALSECLVGPVTPEEKLQFQEVLFRALRSWEDPPAKWVAMHDRLVGVPAVATRPVPHDLYETGDADAPDAIKDGNGEVVLAQCRKCGKAEIQLDESPLCSKGGAT